MLAGRWWRTIARTAPLAAGVLIAASVADDAATVASSTGPEIVFQRAAPDPEVYSMTAEGRRVRRLTRGGGGDPSWSPDGRRIAFSRIVDAASGVQAHLLSVRFDGRGPRRLTRGGELHWQPHWSPDGRRLVFEVWGRRGGSAIGTVSSRGGRRRLLTGFEHDDHAPAFSPDGRRIVFVRGPRDRVSPRRPRDRADLFVMAADGSGQRRLLRHAGEDSQPAWSPDGQWIAFGSNSGGRQFDVFVVRADGSELRRLTRNRGGQPAWSPDGRRIAFASARDGDPEIYVMDADGRNQRKLTDNRVDDQQPEWRPTAGAR